MDYIQKHIRMLKNGLSWLAKDKREPESEKALILEYIETLDSSG